MVNKGICNIIQSFAPMSSVYRIVIAAALLIPLGLAACSKPINVEARYPDRKEGSDKIVYSDEKRATIWGGDDTLGSKLFGKEKEEDAGGTGIGVNSFLWRASLDTISFMPIASADPFGGVILTDWYENPDAPGERFKVNLYILDKQLRADGLRAAVFKQKLGKSQWRDAKIDPQMGTDLENAILSRARELRVAQLGRE